jgi:hypothetical protein
MQSPRFASRLIIIIIVQNRTSLKTSLLVQNFSKVSPTLTLKKDSLSYGHSTGYFICPFLSPLTFRF